jgi:hypothetical protein
MEWTSWTSLKVRQSSELQIIHPVNRQQPVLLWSFMMYVDALSAIYNVFLVPCRGPKQQ